MQASVIGKEERRTGIESKRSGTEIITMSKAGGGGRVLLAGNNGMRFIRSLGLIVSVC